MSVEYIICYDISCPRRLGRVHRLLKKKAMPLQYSVFYFHGTSSQLEHCLTHLQQLIDPRYDDLRAYPLPQRGLRVNMGHATLPEGIYLGNLPAQWQSQTEADNETSSPSAKMPAAVTEAWVIT